MKKMVIAVLVSLMMIGCGGEDNSLPKVDNSTLTNLENDYGYFGKDIVFGSIKIVGYWTLTQESSGHRETINFYEDGELRVQSGNKVYYGDYGLSKDGNEINYVTNKSMLSHTTLQILAVIPSTMRYSDGRPDENINCYTVQYKDISVVANDLTMCPF